MQLINKKQSTAQSAYGQKVMHIKKILGPVSACIGLLLLFIIVFCILTMYASPDQLTATESLEQSFTVLESKGGTYMGPVKDLVYDGVGQFQYIEGGIYTGSFADSQRSGEGTFTWPNGDTYTGTWVDDQMTEGTYTFADGRQFEGTFQGNVFMSGNYSLTGTALQQSGFSSFRCAYANQTISTVNFEKDGLSYSGSLNDQAQITFSNGDTYSGTVKDGIPNGFGTYQWSASGNRYVGDWAAGTMNGPGTYYFTANEYPKLSGQFQNGKPAGTAEYTKEEGNTFSTEWANGQCTKVTET